MNYAVIQRPVKEIVSREMIAPHIEYIKKQVDAGKIILSGPFTDEKRGGMYILDVEDENEMREIADNDPAIISGLMQNEVRKYSISFRQG